MDDERDEKEGEGKELNPDVLEGAIPGDEDSLDDGDFAEDELGPKRKAPLLEDEDSLDKLIEEELEGDEEDYNDDGEDW